MLSTNANFKRNIKANIEYNGSLTVIPYKTASSKEPNANLLDINALGCVPDQQPIITFTKFEIVTEQRIQPRGGFSWDTIKQINFNSSNPNHDIYLDDIKITR